jgi:hypothetical protein
MLDINDVINKYKGTYVYFATIKSNSEDSHSIYISGYGQQVAVLLDKYIEGQWADNEERFEEWDKLVEDARSSVGFSTVIPIDNDCIYVTTFQNGIGISEEDEAGAKRYTSRGRKRRAKISIISADLTEALDTDMGLDHEEDFDLNDEIEEADLDDDE